MTDKSSARASVADVVEAYGQDFDRERLRDAVSGSTNPVSEIIAVLHKAIADDDWFSFSVAVLAGFFAPSQELAAPICLGLIRVGNRRDIEDAVDLLGDVGTDATVPFLLSIAKDNSRDDQMRIKSMWAADRLKTLRKRTLVEIASSSTSTLVASLATKLASR